MAQTLTDNELREWAMTVSPLALKELCPDESWVHNATKKKLVGWLMANDTAVLREMYRLNRPRCLQCGPGYRIGDEGCSHTK